ncbi:MAG: OadG family protein [Alphaproteobacteria bacterium]|nr:OadG family protein [Alphaproteobacteria bacterium]
MTDALYLTFIGMGGVFLFLTVIMFTISVMVWVVPDKKKINSALVAGAVAVALNENGGENG